MGNKMIIVWSTGLTQISPIQQGYLYTRSLEPPLYKQNCFLPSPNSWVPLNLVFTPIYFFSHFKTLLRWSPLVYGLFRLVFPRSIITLRFISATVWAGTISVLFPYWRTLNLLLIFLKRIFRLFIFINSNLATIKVFILTFLPVPLVTGKKVASAEVRGPSSL